MKENTLEEDTRNLTRDIKEFYQKHGSELTMSAVIVILGLMIECEIDTKD